MIQDCSRIRDIHRRRKKSNQKRAKKAVSILHNLRAISDLIFYNPQKSLYNRTNPHTIPCLALITTQLLDRRSEGMGTRGVQRSVCPSLSSQQGRGGRTWSKNLISTPSSHRGHSPPSWPTAQVPCNHPNPIAIGNLHLNPIAIPPPNGKRL